jgi:hypothetical protein
MKLKDFQKALIERKGAKIVSIITITLAELTKEGKEKYGRVWKISHVNGIVNFNYENSVNKQREKEGLEADFVSAPRKWGTKMEGIPFVSHVRKSDGAHELYLEIKVEHVIDTAYRTENGDMLQAIEIWPFIRKSKATLEHQKISKEIIIRTYNVKNIVSMTFDGKTHVLEP